MKHEKTALYQTFGQYFVYRRRLLGINQKELAEKIHREDGTSISATYLNDIEHDRRKPTSDHMIEQFSHVLGVSASYLFFLAGKLPKELSKLPVTQENISKAITAFQLAIKESN